ncbi:amidohydrolase family protein [Mucilaginibacter agri]|uniref:Amidohydrolase family protein n=1 Tax=Mucilaginibacter agri TaxID=2695265 RepID=A0A965ZCY2_9SPHI|nr:amidohydrolase family protein [Mucilaginibacter agri]NCD68719.1 amidohydrolase family protein [Mucilaginibacter agri]
MIIDCHCHAGKGDGLTGPWDTSASLKDYLMWADEYGITKTNLFAAFHSNYSRANYGVSQIVNQSPDRFYGFAFIHAVRDAGKVYEMVKTAVLNYNFCGLKVHRYDARISREICEAAKKFKIPVLYDPMGELGPVELIANEYPEVNFIIPHLSSFADDWKAQVGFISILERYKNIYTDTSAVRRFDVLQEALQRAGPEKILFGSDGPWIHPGVELTKIYALHLSGEAEDMILGRNFLRLIKSNVNRSLYTKNHNHATTI